MVFFSFFSFFLSFLSQAFVSYLHGLFCCLCLLSFLMSSDAKKHIRDKLRCRPNDAVASARPRECAAIFP